MYTLFKLHFRGPTDAARDIKRSELRFLPQCTHSLQETSKTCLNQVQKHPLQLTHLASPFTMPLTCPSSLSILSFLLTTSTLAESGITTRYWDCCEPSCAWPGKAQVSEPVRSCNKNDKWPSSAGFSGLDSSLGSGSTGGGLNAGLGSGSICGGLNAGSSADGSSLSNGLSTGLILDPNARSSCDEVRRMHAVTWVRGL